MFLDDLIRMLWKWWQRYRRVKQFRTWNRMNATVVTCRVIDEILGERLQITFRYEINAEGYTGLALSKERRSGTTLKLEDDVLEGHALIVRVNPDDAGASGVLNEDNPQWPWEIEE